MIGHGRAPLPVPVGTPMDGYDARPGPSTGTLDGLEVHAVTIAAGGTRFVWAVADLAAVNRDLAAAAAEWLRVPPELLWLGATHTHAGPDVGCQPGGGPTPGDWLPRTLTALGRAVDAAVAAERPGALTVHSGLVGGVGAQRSGPSPRLDVPVTVLAARDGVALRGAVVVLPVHPTVLPADNLRVSADLAGAVRRAVADRLGCWVMVATGAAGDVSTRAHRRAQDPVERDRLADLAADQIVALVHGGGVPVEVSSPVVGRREVVRLPSRNGEAVPGPGAARERLAAARRSGDQVAIREAQVALQGAELAATARVADPRLAVSAVRIGGLRLVGFGGEPYLDLADAVTAALPAPVAVAGYTNGYLGYLPTRTAYGTGVYEAYIAPAAAGAAEQAAAAAIALARDL